MITSLELPGKHKNQILIYRQHLWEHVGLNVVASRLSISLWEQLFQSNKSLPWIQYMDNEWKDCIACSMQSNDFYKTFEYTDQTPCTYLAFMPHSHHSPYKLSHLCSFPRESPTVFFTSSFPGLSTCSFKPANPPKGIFSASLFSLLLYLKTVSWYLTGAFSSEKGKKNPLDVLLHPSWVCGTRSWLHLSVESLRGNTDFTFPPFSTVRRGISAEMKGWMMFYSSVSKAPFNLWNVFHLQKIRFRERFINIRKRAN